jgi:hypothetical protein
MVKIQNLRPNNLTQFTQNARPSQKAAYTKYIKASTLHEQEFHNRNSTEYSNIPQLVFNVI